MHAFSGQRLGILGGTFNPPHVGHLALAHAALEQMGLERVLMVPARVAPHKQLAEDPGTEHRLSMCRLAAAGDQPIEVCTLELERPGPSYTVDTLQAIHASHPAAELTLIVGADTARTLPGWRQPDRLLSLADLAIAARAGTERQPVLEALRELHAQRRVTFLEMAPVAISSSTVRRRVLAGEPVQELVGGPVADYIERHGLYREGMRPPLRTDGLQHGATAIGPSEGQAVAKGNEDP